MRFCVSILVALAISGGLVLTPPGRGNGLGVSTDDLPAEDSAQAGNADLAQAYYQSGLSIIKQNKYEDAVERLKKAVAYRPEFPQALFKLGECSEKLKDTPKAVFYYRRCLKSIPERSPLAEEKQIATTVTARLDKIDTAGKELARIKSNYAASLVKLANDCLAKKYNGFARRFLDLAVAVEPANKPARELLAKMGPAKAPTKTVRKPDKPKSPSEQTEITGEARAAYNRAESYLLNRNVDKAIESLNEAIAKCPYYAKALVKRGSAYFQMGNFDAALDDLTQAINVDPKSDEAYYYRSGVYFAQGEMDKALEDSNAAIKLSPKQPAFLGGRANIHARMGNYEQAIADGEQLLKIVPPSNPLAAQMRGQINEWRQKLK
ncbi:MAG: tetratricopeptide repeat protein [Planctomycetes bacterium]|nr:tetratricopeptide repeat protein [Planctomycetota bacterium]